MVNVSADNLENDVRCNIEAQFEKTLLALKNNERDIAYLHELISDMERLALAKRLAMIMMLSEGCSWSNISDTLGVSRSSINEVSRGMKAGKYATILASIQKQRARASLWKDLEYIIRGTHR